MNLKEVLVGLALLICLCPGAGALCSRGSQFPGLQPGTCEHPSLCLCTQLDELVEGHLGALEVIPRGLEVDLHAQYLPPCTYSQGSGFPGEGFRV